MNRLPQTVHWNSFCPEWLCTFLASALLSWQHLPHSVHLCLFIWRCRWFWDEYRFLHWLHTCTFSAVWRFLACSNFFSETASLHCVFDCDASNVSMCKPFVTHSTQIRSWLVIMWTFSDIIAASFSLYLKRFSCVSVIRFSLMTYIISFVFYHNGISRKLRGTSCTCITSQVHNVTSVSTWACKYQHIFHTTCLAAVLMATNVGQTVTALHDESASCTNGKLDSVSTSIANSTLTTVFHISLG